jgi:hypothetical protein
LKAKEIGKMPSVHDTWYRPPESQIHMNSEFSFCRGVNIDVSDFVERLFKIQCDL